MSRSSLRASGLSAEGAQFEISLKINIPVLGKDGKIRTYGKTRKDRDAEVMRLYGTGMSCRQIASEMGGISYSRVSRIIKENRRESN